MLTAWSSNAETPTAHLTAEKELLTVSKEKMSQFLFGRERALANAVYQAN